MEYNSFDKLEVNSSRPDKVTQSRLRRLVLALTQVVLLGSMGMTLVVRAYNNHASSVAVMRERSAEIARTSFLPVTNSAQSPSPGQRLEVAAVTLRTRGFEPAQVTRPRGRLLLAVFNRSGLREPLYTLDRVAGNRLHEVHIPREKLDWRNVMTLEPGRYILSEASHPNWVCKIDITAD